MVKIELRKPNKSSPYYRIEFDNPIMCEVSKDIGTPTIVQVGLTKNQLRILLNKLQ